MSRFEIVVAGGGLVGQVAAVTLARRGCGVLHLAPPAPADRRTSALMQPSLEFLAEHGLLADLASIGTPLRRIRIIDATGRLLRAPETLFDAAEIGLDSFGWNLPNAALAARFAELADATPGLEVRPVALQGLTLGASDVTLRLEDGSEIVTALLVGADGKRSLVRAAAGFRMREGGYRQSALVCDLTLARPLGDTSVEFHYANGPFTLVPAGGDRANLVYVDTQEALDQARALEPADLARLFETKSQGLFGAITVTTPLAVFPLSSLTVPEPGKDGVVLVGEAAHAFPPIGAQGLNLGFRDIDDLVAALSGAVTSRPGWGRVVAADYARRRSGDLARTGAFVDGLFHSLISEHLPAQMLRSAGLWGLRGLPGLRRAAFAFGMGRR